ncbi:DEAD/DEAH box helicase, partial [Thermodesulfovibrio yellowstonii]|uniref:DEAD/DEAH box helicase n=1 Tax=Thermodesulfovibrio yellowstonii TaxID=28262 RepID=UPI003C7DF6E4
KDFMKEAILLKESLFSLDGKGKVIYELDGIKKEAELVKSSTIDSRIPYKFLNPLQSLFHYLYKNGNAIVSAPSSAGKSLIGYLFFLKNDRGGIKLYSAPTKSLVYEKAREFKTFYSSLSVRTGDNIVELLKPVTQELVLSTYENMAYTFRNRGTWLQNIDCIVFDEIHHIVKKWIVEEAIVYAIERGIPIIGLSATLPGLKEIAEWMNCELVIKSDWRPVSLQRNLYILKDFKPAVKVLDGAESRLASKILGAVMKLRQNEEKVIVFVPKKTLGWRVLEFAQQHGLSIMNVTAPFEVKLTGTDIAFHNADIPQEERHLIEREFRYGNLNILIATQTLAYGVNLPADRTIIAVKGWFDMQNFVYRYIPDVLDILQEEGRAGRLGIKEIGYSDWLLYGIKEESLKESINETLTGKLKTELMYAEASSLIDALSLWIPVGYLYLGSRYRDFLKKTFSLKNVSESVIKEVEGFLRQNGYITEDSLTEKGAFCVRSGIPPLRFEEFLIRLSRMAEFSDLPAVIRPLLHMRRFDGLFPFIENAERFHKDLSIVYNRLSRFGSSCINDNTHQFIFFTEGLTFYYPNIGSPPGEFSAIRTDALHLMRALLELRKLRVMLLSNQEILSLVHTIKYGIPIGYSQLGAIPKIGHIRGNLLRITAQKLNLEMPRFGMPTREFFDYFLTEKNLKLMGSILLSERKIQKDRVASEISVIVQILKENRDTPLIDRDILNTFGVLLYAHKALSMKKDELIERVCYGTY